MAEKLTFTANASSYTGINSGSNYIKNAVGKTAENYYTGANNWYSSRTAAVDSRYAQYTFDLSSIPENAENIKVGCSIAGKAENSTYNHSAGGRYSVWRLCCNGTGKSEQIHATATSIKVYTFSNTGTWTRDELNGLQLRHYVGYYGGGTAGITLTIEYTTGGAEQGTGLFVKQNGAFVEAVKIYKKTNGAWAEIDRATLDTRAKYKYLS